MGSIIQSQGPALELIRLEESEQGTFGVLKIQKRVFCWTLEPSDEWNQTSTSCIPAQQYTCIRHFSATHGETFMVTNVPMRVNILFHSGNVKNDTRGCILLGQTLGKLRGDRAVLNSGETFKSFMDELTNYNTAHLTIVTYY